MSKLNFASFAQAIELGMPQPNKIKATLLMFDFITNKDFVRDKNDQPYVIKKDQVSRWWAEKANVTKVLQKAADKPVIVQEAPNHFDNIVIPELITSQKESLVYNEVYSLIDNDNSISQDVKDELLGYFVNQDYGAFLGHSFLYAIVCKNNSKRSIKRAAREKAVSESPEIQEYRRLRERFPKPELIPPPEEIEERELPYVTELLRAYSNAAGMPINEPDELDGTYKKHFDRQRKDYYAAETIRQSARDTLRLNEADGFDLLKEETYAGVIDTSEDTYSDAVKRLKAVLKAAAGLPLSHNLELSLLGWVGSSEKKGVCHMLVNDDKLRWVDDDE